jgi:vacuolar-type H+-ATPase subunit I/STV1
MSEARSAKALEYLSNAERCAALAEKAQDSQRRNSYRELVGQWQDMAKQAERMDEAVRELKAELAELQVAERRVRELEAELARLGACPSSL